MARTVRLARRNQGSGGGALPYGEWIPAHAVRFNEDGTTSVMTEEHAANRGRRRRNVAAGFYDEEGIFHPIRASYDYSRKRAGEKAAPKRKPAKRKRAKAKAKARRR